MKTIIKFLDLDIKSGVSTYMVGLEQARLNYG
jgi:hypothetical protein